MKSIYKKTIRDSKQSQKNRRRVSNFSRRKSVKNANHRDLFLDLLHLLIGFRKLISETGTFLPALIQAHCSGPKRKTNNETLDLLLFSGCYFECFFFRHEKMRVLPLFYCCSDYFLKRFSFCKLYRAQHLISLFFFFHLFCMYVTSTDLWTFAIKNTESNEGLVVARGENWRTAKNGDKRNTNISESFISCAHTHTFTEGPHYVSAAADNSGLGFLVIFQKVSFHTWGVFWF